MLGILCQHTGLPWRDLQADWNSRVRSRHVILPPVNGHPPAVGHKQPAAVWRINNKTSLCVGKLTSKVEYPSWAYGHTCLCNRERERRRVKAFRQTALTVN